MGRLVESDQILCLNAVIEGNAQRIARAVCAEEGWQAGFEVFTSSIGVLPADPDRNSVEEYLASLLAGWAWIDALSAEEDGRVRASYAAEDEAAGRDVLRYAVRFPALLVIAFGAIFLWFRARGGYKPIELTEA